MRKIQLEPIGVIHSSYRTPEETPKQAIYAEKEAVIEIFPLFQEGLFGLEEFDFIIVLVYLDKINDFNLKTISRMTGKEAGIFATRSPRRPNPIGLSVVELIKVEKNLIYVKGIDFFDGTPVLDIKPFVRKLDCK